MNNFTLLGSNTSSSSSSSHSGLDVSIAKLDDLLTMVGSALSGCAIVFTMILYGHHKHLHSNENHLFIFGILGVCLLASSNYFFCIFTNVSERSSNADYFSPSRCDACGFVEQIHSFAEPFLSTLFWAQIYCMIHKIELYIFQGPRQVAFTILCVWVFGICTAAMALANDWYVQDMQSWCWIAKDVLWFKLCFCWIWVFTTCVSMCAALANPLCSDTLNATQKRLVWRRALLGLSWVVVSSVDVCSRFLRDDAASIVQALCEPLLGVVNVIAFLYSERMMTLHALGLPPGGEPTYGFTAAMRYIPDKIRCDESSILISR